MGNYHFLEILSLISIIVSVMAIVFIYQFNKLSRSIIDREQSKSVYIGFQREKLENSIYKGVEDLTKDPVIFSDTNHLILDASNNNNLKSNREVPNLSYFNDLGIIDDEFVVQDRQITCFKFNGYDCMRTDEEKIESNVNLRKYIVTKIIQAQLVVAVLDGRNPNVLYEVGIAHAIGKLVILVVKRDKSNDLPENLKGNRLLIYKNENDLFEQLSSTLNSVEYA